MATQQSAAAAADKDTFSSKVATASVPTLVRILKVCNFVNAGFLCAAGILVFVLSSPNTLEVLSAIYVIIFSLLLLCFECHLKRFEKMVYRNFGFMFHWQGRIIFFFFIGTLSFGLGTWGIVAGCVTVVNVIFNVYVLRTNEFYRQHLADQANEMRQRARSDLPAATVAGAASPTGAGTSAVPASQPSTYGGYNSGATNTLATVAVNAAIANPEAAVKVATVGLQVAGTVAAQPAAGGSEWEKFLDEDTGTYYYFNHRTQETRWEEPK